MNFDPEQHSLKCPKCGSGMLEVRHDEVTLDRCSNCQGLWLDTGEAERLKATPRGHELDAGDPMIGWRWDRTTDIKCPRCGKAMRKTSDPKQAHIWYEVCDVHGSFMDAGEFTDYKFETLFDRFRGALRGGR